LQVQGTEQVLVQRASHPHPAVRAATLAAAGDLGGPANRRLVLNSLQMAGAEDADWLVRSSAMLALAKIGGPGDLDLIQRVYRSGGGEASWLARSALARVVAALHPRPQRTLEAMIQDPDIRVAVTAATGMAQTGLFDVLSLYLRSGVPQIRAAAVGGVRQAGLVRWLPRLRHMARWDRSREVRWAVAVALFAMEDPAGDELMIEGLKAREITVWAGALAHLSRRTGASHGRDAKAWRAELKRWRAR
jgi:HEAT repeat protein